MKKFDSINVIPFIDIMLVLLAIVLTTATFISNGKLDIALPRANSDSTSVNRQTVEIAIDRQERFYIDGTATSIDALRSQLGGLAKDTPIVLKIDETVEFRQFVSVVDLLKSLSLDKVSIITREGA
ncbi:MAG: biopolymer transporter ExbD [Granulosicoccus sp.]|nr:biopolymer transporter ExbD [Granulosicoccus sp.]